MTHTPLLYFWLMSHVLISYLIGIVVVCYFFRKVCQDPNITAETEKKEEYADQLKAQQKGEENTVKL